MHKANVRAITTKLTSVEISMNDGSSVSGKIWVPIQGRLSDVLNDDRGFFPVECRDGSLIVVAKTAVKQILVPPEEVLCRGNPHSVLGIREGASPEEVKNAYHRLCAAHHPDRIKGLGLGADYEDVATQNMVRINSAYTQLTKQEA